MRQRSRGSLRSLAIGLAALPLMLMVAAPASAQTPSPVPLPSVLTITTTYPSLTVDPGNDAIFPLQVTAPTVERVDLTVSDVPTGFKATLKGGGAIIGSVTTSLTTPPDVKLDVKVPDDATPGDYKLTVNGTAASGTASLVVDLVVGDTSAGQVTMTTDFPTLKGPASATYQFNLRLTNDTAQEITFGLQGTGPDGWDVQAQPSGQSQAATAVVAAGSSQSVQVTVKPASDADAGKYPISVTATGGPQPVTTDLGVEITGSYSMTLSSPDGRLNTQVTTGGSTQYTVVVTNTGTAPLTNVKLTGTPPSGWTVTWDNATIDSIDVGATAQQIRDHHAQQQRHRRRLCGQHLRARRPGQRHHPGAHHRRDLVHLGLRRSHHHRRRAGRPVPRLPTLREALNSWPARR